MSVHDMRNGMSFDDSLHGESTQIELICIVLCKSMYEAAY